LASTGVGGGVTSHSLLPLLKMKNLAVACLLHSCGPEVLGIMKKITLLLAGALIAMAPLGASAAVRVFVGPPAFGYGFYGPAYWGPGYAYAPYYYSNTGEVKIDSKVKTAEVFVNGAYAGTVKDNKTMHLRQGNYKIEIHDGGQTTFAENVYVTAGKTMHIAPAM